MLKQRQYIALADVFLINLSAMICLVVLAEGEQIAILQNHTVGFLILTLVWLLSLSFFGLYNRVWEYASIHELVSTIKAVTLASLVSFILIGAIHDSLAFSIRFSLINWFINIVFIGGLRLFLRVLRQKKGLVSMPQTVKRTLIVGAGDAGVLVARELNNHYQNSVHVVGFIDDDPGKQKKKLLEHKVLGTRSDIPEIVNKHGVEEIIIAMPSVSGKEIHAIVDICHNTNVDVKMLPGVFEIIDGDVTISQIREVQVEDLLGRKPVKVDLESMSDYIQNKVVLVTGAGGSIGSELCRQLVKLKPKVLLMLDISENGIHNILLDLQEITDVPLVPLIKDIREAESINRVFVDYQPDVVYHAAAHKHVPLMESNPEEAIKNNCIGTYNVAKAASVNKAKRFVLVSTDKAVNPTSVMGASKRIAEMIIQHLNNVSRTHFVGVRFGNVLGSQGSVVPLFKKQIAKGGPVTVTDENMVRYFMTIPEAVQLIIQAGAFAHDGEIFVLDMGEPVKIIDLAETLIKLSGFDVDEIGITITGMRPGEKMYEELLTTDEVRSNRTKHERIFIAPPTPIDHEGLLDALSEFATNNTPNGQATIESWIQRLLPEFTIVHHDKSEPVRYQPIQEVASAREL